MKILLAVKSCERDAHNGFNQTIRDTWGRDVRGADFRFFVGRGRRPLRGDEVRLQCGDEYLDLPRKTQAILTWASAREYDFVFLCDTDTFVVPHRLMASGFEAYDYVGHFGGRPGVPEEQKIDDETRTWAWASGGCGYWLSRRAAEVVLGTEPSHWAEDFWVGSVLGPKIADGSLSAVNHPGYGSDVSMHYCSRGKNRTFDVSWMGQCYLAAKRQGH